MKKIIYTLSFLFFFANMNAQEYVLGNNSVWSYLFPCDFPIGEPCGATYAYKVSEISTDMDGLEYFEILQFQRDYYPDYMDTDWWGTGVFVRETNDQKFYVKEGANPEILSYDFGLEIGEDFIMNPLDTNPYSRTVTDIDTIVDLEGQERKRIIFDNDPYSAWIEGMGSEDMFFNFFSSSEIVCFSSDNNLHYNPHTDGECFVYIVNNEEVENLGVNIFPNPTENSLQIEMDENNFDIFIFNTLGQIVLQEKNSSKQLNISHLDKGIYFINIETEGKKYKQKIIKNSAFK